MEAYGAACVSYAQQLFAFSNRELVARGHYGPAPPAPGMTFTQPGGQNGNGYNSSSQTAMPAVTMPVRIDPEEEKRLAILRKRVAASEAKREVLETEYLSLRAHYVHESHKLRRTKSLVNGQLKMLRDLVSRRGRVLALRRVRCAVANDVLACLEHRSKAKVAQEISTESANDSDVVMEAHSTGGISPKTLETTPGQSQIDDINDVEMHKNEVPLDMIDVWSHIDAELQTAELACSEVSTPDELLYIKSALCADATALEAANEASATNGSGSGTGAPATTSNGRRSRSPNRLKEGNGKEEEEEAVSAIGANGKPKKKSRDERYAKRGSEDGSSSSGSKKKSDTDCDDNVIPWSCRVMPMTPYGVALYLSNLSNSPELAAAYACDNIFGSAPQSLTWLESNLPSDAEPGAKSDKEELRKIREQVEALEAELANEVKTNSDLQKEIFDGRKKNDEMCAMMTMIRTETEAVVHRHNQILDTNEALITARILYESGAVGSKSINNTGIDDQDMMGFKEEGEIEDDDDDGTVIADDEDDADAFGVHDNLSKYGGNYDASDEDDSVGQPVLEIMVPNSGKSIAEGSNQGSTMNNKRGYGSTDEVNMDPDKKRRKV